MKDQQLLGEVAESINVDDEWKLFADQVLLNEIELRSGYEYAAMEVVVRG